MTNEIVKDTAYDELIDEIGEILLSAKQQVAVSVNTVMIQTYWNIGRYIVEYEQSGFERATYGENLLEQLSKDLTLRFGKGFSRSNISYMRKFYITFQKCVTLSHKLSWSHYYELLKLEDPLEISFYAQECEQENWSVRELRRQIKSMLFHRLALSKDKNEVLKLANEGIEIQTVEDIVKDPYVLEFVGIQPKDVYKESDLEKALLDNLQAFLLELGKGFAFIGRQYPINVGGRHYFVDMVFYHRILKCFVLIDLKRGEIQHEDIGQMNFYLNYFRNEENTDGDNEPVGIVLGAYKDKLVMEYALQGISTQLFVSQYQLYLPNRELLENQLKTLLENSEED